MADVSSPVLQRAAGIVYGCNAIALVIRVFFFHRWVDEAFMKIAASIITYYFTRKENESTEDIQNNTENAENETIVEEPEEIVEDNIKESEG